MKTKNRALKGRIVQMYGSQRAFAEALGISPQRVNYKCNSNYVFSCEEAMLWCKVLGIEPDDGYLHYRKEFYA